MESENPGGRPGASSSKSNAELQYTEPGPRAVNDLLTHALNYGRNGVRVFPCYESEATPEDCRSGCRECRGHGEKSPYTKRGFHDAATDPKQIIDWWIRWPSALIGAPVPPGRCIIDFDPRHGGTVAKLEDLVGHLTPTLTVWSGRNDGGHHLFYRRPQGELVSTKLPKGIDLKDAGKGYTILPPSPHPLTGQPYRWETKPINNMSASLAQTLMYTRPIAHWPSVPSEGRLAGLLKTMINAEPNTRNKTLHWCGCRVAEANYSDSAWDALAQAALAAGLPEREIQSTLRSARRTATGEIR